MSKQNQNQKRKKKENLGRIISKVTQEEMNEKIKEFNNKAGWEQSGSIPIPEKYIEKVEQTIPTFDSEEKEKEMENINKNKYANDCRRYWDIFYKRNTNKAFKNKNYIYDEWFKPLIEGEMCDKLPLTCLEVGCGTGALIYPVLRRSENSLKFIGFDLSDNAIEILKNDEEYDPKKVLSAFAYDIVKKELPEEIVKTNSIDICTLCFVLSAITPQNQLLVLKRLFSYLKPGGVLFFRDYARYDLSQVRFNQETSRIAEKLYVRVSGTLSYFFEKKEIHDLMTQAGFEVIECDYLHKEILNRKELLVMHRIWLIGKFRKPFKKQNENQNEKENEINEKEEEENEKENEINEKEEEKEKEKEKENSESEITEKEKVNLKIKENEKKIQNEQNGQNTEINTQK
ncbi:methyltransferase-like protein [Anaeramoeba flamelloides]|uniref:Methyltransferase-like protein n=1 Tax=Anaeramoeba flamelloides TaxID=1746091 RepID=A0AAV7YRK5_9EUKA|nr:methyltransferase-like protein [Anaeramoeba flamelloides]